MSRKQLHEQLTKLHEVILREREAARNLDLEELALASQEKAALLNTVRDDGKLASETKELAERVRTENRRNAFLFWSTLNWIRESMTFIDQRAESSSYDPVGRTHSRCQGGRLLSGRI